MKHLLLQPLHPVAQSLPSRERELKPHAAAGRCHHAASLPSRERELKLYKDANYDSNSVSLPSRERELKLIRNCVRTLIRKVAPLAGARIETPSWKAHGMRSNVAPLAGARIETCDTRSQMVIRWVAPLAGARIETSSATAIFSAATVAPLAGARIETRDDQLAACRVPSLPSRERKLKPPATALLGTCRCRSPRGSAN